MSADICKAIATRVLISFNYKGVNRTVEPHIVGRNKKGALSLSAWQLSGGSGIGWRDYLVIEMSGILISDQPFSAPRPGYNPNDTTLAEIICRI